MFQRKIRRADWNDMQTMRGRRYGDRRTGQRRRRGMASSTKEQKQIDRPEFDWKDEYTNEYYVNRVNLR